MYEEVEDAIPKIEIIGRKLTNTISEVDELKTLIEDLKEDVARSKMEIKKWKALMMLFFVCACFVTICIVFLVFGKAKKTSLHLLLCSFDLSPMYVDNVVLFEFVFDIVVVFQCAFGMVMRHSCLFYDIVVFVFQCAFDPQPKELQF